MKSNRKTELKYKEMTEREKKAGNEPLSNLSIDPAISRHGLNSRKDYLRLDIEAELEVWGLRKTFKCFEQIQFGGSRAALSEIDAGESRDEISTTQRKITGRTGESCLRIRNLISIIREHLVSQFGQNALNRLSFGDSLDSRFG
jgi:hypothetical protein